MVLCITEDFVLGCADIDDHFGIAQSHVSKQRGEEAMRPLLQGFLDFQRQCRYQLMVIHRNQWLNDMYQLQRCAVMLRELAGPCDDDACLGGEVDGYQDSVIGAHGSVALVGELCRQALPVHYKQQC